MLRATVDYSDGHGPGKSAESTNTGAVTTVDPPGTVSLSTTSPEEGTAVTATLSDPSGGIDDVKWQWQRRSHAADEWGGISSATSPSYTPVAGDVGYMLRATVGYSDGHGPNKSAHSGATAAVIGEPVLKDLKAVAGDRQVSLSWSEANSNGSSITHYEHRRIDPLPPGSFGGTRSTSLLVHGVRGR